MSNRMNQAYVNAYRSAQHAEARNELRRERTRVAAEIEALTKALADAQEDVQEERSWWNTLASATGCAVGGILGSGGGPAGVLSGCTLGSNLLSTGVDYTYDELYDTDLEKTLQIKEAALREYDVELSDLSKKYPEYGALEWEEDVEKQIMDNMDLYDQWEEGFYGKEGLDYAMDVVGVVATYGATKVGGAVLNELWASAFPESDFAIDLAKSKDITKISTGTGIGQFTYQLPDVDAGTLWRQYVIDNKIYSGNY